MELLLAIALTCRSLVSFVLTKDTYEDEGATEFLLLDFYYACVPSDNQALHFGTTATCIAQN